VAVLTPAQFGWLATRGSQIATVMCLDEVSVHEILVTAMHGKARSDNEATALAYVAAFKLAQLAGWDTGEVTELLDEMGFARLVGTEAA
jgi:hypothetical protein